jgi:tetratricopeptide (TPR) repeat protein
MELSDEAKDLIAHQFAQLSKSNEATLRELNVYRWALRTFFVVLFGGSILGVLKLQDYLDDRIQKRSEDLSAIIYGNAAQSSGDPSSAIEQYGPFLEKLENPVFRPSEAIRAIYYYRFIQALADDPQVDANGDFLVGPAYAALLESKTYKRDLVSNQRKWNQDAIILNARARCLVKFEGTQEGLREAAALFRRASGIADRASDKASNYFALAMMSLAAGDTETARTNFVSAMETSPRSHGIKQYIGIYRQDLESEYQIWDRAARLYGRAGVGERYESVMKSLIVERAGN